MQKKTFYSVGSLALLLVLFVAVNILAGDFLRGSRFDLTENKLFTLSEGTRSILGKLKEPVTLHFYFSQGASRDLPQVRSYAKRVEEMLEEFENHSNGKLKVERIDPEPFSEEEDRAATLGLKGVPVNQAGDTLYMGIVGSNTLDDVQAMPFLQPDKEKFLEYDLAKMVSTLGNPKKQKLGIISSLPMQAGFDPATQSMREPWVIDQQLQQLFDIQFIQPGSDELPKDLDLLMLVHPKNLDETSLYEIEQFVLGGGHLIAFLDPFAEADRGNQNDPMAQMQAGSASTLGPLLKAWGVGFDPSRVVGDLQYGIGSGANRHIGILSVPKEGMNADDIVSADLEVVNFSSTGWFEPLEDATTKFETLVQSSENAAPLDSSRLRFLSNPADLMKGFNPTGDRYTLVARISGPAKAVLEAPEGLGDGRLAESGDGGINVMLFADTDMLTDRLWVQKQPFMGQNLVSAFADNGSLAVNAVDNMLGNRDLISIRTRATSARPFERVDALRVRAEQAYRAKEERLQQELDETEKRLTELQSARGDGDLTVISDEQQEELQRFLNRKLEIRKELRQVQHDLQRDIDRLDVRLKLINIAVVPAIVLVFALVYDVRRRRKQSGTKSEEGGAHEP
ncbi:MAG: Gldg family protein [Lysobacterales bacterium]|jgi:ABC-type uncharacterized transport system involved in gliding motility auxiliary subunit